MAFGSRKGFGGNRGSKETEVVKEVKSAPIASRRREVFVSDTVVDSGHEEEVAKKRPAHEKIIKETEKNKTKNPVNTPVATKVVTPFDKRKAYRTTILVKVYGDVLFELNTKEDKARTNEDIRVSVVEDYGYAELTKEKAIFDFIEEAGILVVEKKHEPKG